MRVKKQEFEEGDRVKHSDTEGTVTSAEWSHPWWRYCISTHSGSIREDRLILIERGSKG